MNIIYAIILSVCLSSCSETLPGAGTLTVINTNGSTQTTVLTKPSTNPGSSVQEQVGKQLAPALKR